jgi:ABC-2 type transport system ATP-binding protein
VLILHRGAIVADGSPADLTRPRGIEVELASGTRLFEGALREDAPRIVAELVAAGEQVFEVRLLRSTLEERYLEVVA